MYKESTKKKGYNLLNIAPTKIIVLSFAILIMTGAILLSTPIASKSGQWTPFIDALFTATSASCITGLVVFDTFLYWSTFGQIVILSLIQVGALGIVTLATFFSVLLGKKVGLKGMLLAQESINILRYDEVLKLISKIVLVTLGIEIIGATLLSSSFVPKYGPIGFYMGIFHSISAFCNAGFDIMSASGNGQFLSMTEFNNDPIVIYTISALIIIGGLGFSVWKDLYEYRKTKCLLFHTKVVLIITTTLLVGGAIFFFFSEYNNTDTMGSFTIFEKINASFFHSTSTRTAGYNSVPLKSMKEISKVITVFLMFIGAAPGSTGGGIKVTTIGVLIFAIISQIRGSSETVLFKRKILQYTINKALAITGLSAMLIITMTTIILAVEPQLTFIDTLYEVTSAFGTVGLSLDVTTTLSSLSKSLLVLTMFLGRVGPLSFAIALTLKAQKRATDVVYPDAKIIVG